MQLFLSLCGKWNPPKRRFVIVLALVLVWAGVIFPETLRSQDTNGTSEAMVAPERMLVSLENALEGQKADLADLQSQLQQLGTLQNAIQSEINAYESQNAAHGQLLLVPQLRIEDLENALKNNRLALRTLEERIKSFQGRWDSVSIQLEQVVERIDVAQKQVADVRQAEFPGDQQKRLEATTRKLLGVLQEKQKLGERYLKICGGLLDQMKAAQAEKTAIGAKLAAQLESRQKESLLERSTPLRALSAKAFKEELQLAWSRVKAIFSAATWQTQWTQIRMGGFARWTFFLAIFTVVLALQGRLRRFLRRLEAMCEAPERYYRRLTIYLLRHSLLFVSMALLFGIYTSQQMPLFNIGLGRLLSWTFLVLAITRWGLDYLAHGFRGPDTALRVVVTRHLTRFFRVFRIVALISILLIWILGRDSLLYWLVRILVSAVFLAWAGVFWQHMNAALQAGRREGQPAPNPTWMGILKGGFYLFVGGTLVLSVAGYGALAGQWATAWTETLVLLFWAWISLRGIQEWRSEHRALAVAADTDHALTITHQRRWMLIQLVKGGWLLGLAAGLLWAWDRTGFLREQLGQFFNWTLTVGSLNLSIKGVVLAAVILFITYGAVRLGRALLDEKILQQQTMERGLKDSILTITSYLGWGFGLLLALGLLGVNATSLAVVFGALSIGIGFGLQNIFNNFISGLILLFERPIQVGDYVEVGGLWAEVKKINVRSTVVQTFDNASVIIPNSDFISQQVTNWSFKDKRMRRNIEVGVAYGSDIDLVENTLLEIVKDRRRVLKYPKPEVLFIDHADSALIFRLRIWVHVDDYWSIPSRIRFDIDRRFRELGIEIAFPQRDLHIRTLPEKMRPPEPSG